jgi:hypothetical protein
MIFSYSGRCFVVLLLDCDTFCNLYLRVFCKANKTSFSDEML